MTPFRISRWAASLSIVCAFALAIAGLAIATEEPASAYVSKKDRATSTATQPQERQLERQQQRQLERQQQRQLERQQERQLERQQERDASALQVVWPGEELGMRATAARKSTSTPALSFPTDQTFGLHSNPGAPNVIFLDFDGELSPTADAVDAPAFDLDGSPDTFTEAEHANMQAIWIEVADDFAAFNVDVTTEHPPGLDVVPSVIQVLFGFNYTFHQQQCGTWCAGLARNQTFGASLVFARPHFTAHENAAIATHELGHEFGLVHDGWLYPDGSNEEYYSGHGNWAPTMGGPTGAGITHFATGNYAPTPNNGEDDLAILMAHLGLRSDDHSDTGDWGGATALASAGESIRGVIEDRFDTDAYTYTVPCNGTTEIAAVGPTYGGNADLELTVLSTNGAAEVINPVTADAPTYPDTGLNTAATITSSEGDAIRLSVDGVGARTEGVDGYSDYGSIGGYHVRAHTNCTNGAQSAPMVSINSPHPGTTFFGDSAAVAGEVTGTGPVPASVEVLFESGIGTETVLAPVAADGTWQATIEVGRGEHYAVTATASDARATTTFSTWIEPQGSPAILSFTFPRRNAEVAGPVRLTGVAIDTIGLGRPTLTLQHPDGRYWNGTAFTADRVDLEITNADDPGIERGWQYLFEPSAADTAPGSYTARISLGQAVVGSSAYTTFHLGSDVDPPQISRLDGSPSGPARNLIWNVYDERELNRIEVISNPDLPTERTEIIALSGYHATVEHHLGAADTIVTATLFDAAGNATQLPTTVVDAPYVPLGLVLDGPVQTVDGSLTISGRTEHVGQPGTLLDHSLIRATHHAETPDGPMRWHPIWGWHPGPAEWQGIPTATDGVHWSYELEPFGTVTHSTIIDAWDPAARSAIFFGGQIAYTSYDGAVGEFAVDVNVHLEGPSAPTSEMMRDDLRMRNLLPLSDPYTGTATTTAAVLSTTGVRAPVDWVLASFRPTADPTGPAIEVPGLVLRDGSVVAADGFSPLTVPAVSGSYYVTMSHRNHLPVTTTVELGPTYRLHIDFGESTTSALLNLGAHQRCDEGSPCQMIAGNSHQDGIHKYLIDGDDKNLFSIANGLFLVYDIADHDLSGDVSLPDKNLWFNNFGLFAPVPPWE